jgi:hypothetical protein
MVISCVYKKIEEIRLDRLANKDSEDEVLDDLSDSEESITMHAAVAAVQEPKEGQVKTQSTSNPWQLSKPEFDINLPMPNDNRGNNFGQYVIPPTSNSVNERVRDYLATQNLAHDKSMRKNLFILTRGSKRFERYHIFWILSC